MRLLLEQPQGRTPPSNLLASEVEGRVGVRVKIEV